MGYIEFREVSKFYTTGDTRIAAAEKLTFTIEKSEFCVIVGPERGAATAGMGALLRGLSRRLCNL